MRILKLRCDELIQTEEAKALEDAGLDSSHLMADVNEYDAYINIDKIVDFYQDGNHVVINCGLIQNYSRYISAEQLYVLLTGTDDKEGIINSN